MVKNLRAALAGRGVDRPTFEASPVLARPGERAMPGALLVERRRVQPDPDQPRKHFDEAKLQELADSIREVGILQPLRVRTAPDGTYIIVNGERRWRAAELADAHEVPVVVRDSPADQLAFEMLIENVQREDLTDQEEAAAFKVLIDQGYTTEQIATRLGVSKARVSKQTRVFEQPALAEPVMRGEMTKSQAQELLTAPRELQQPLAEAVAEARRAGNVVPIGELRSAVREAREAIGEGRSPGEVMESVSSRNGFRPAASPVRAHERRRPVDRAFDDLLRCLEGFLDAHREARPSADRVARMVALIERYESWVEQNGVAE